MATPELARNAELKNAHYPLLSALLDNRANYILKYVAANNNSCVPFL